jgi:hypothetical protein
MPGKLAFYNVQLLLSSIPDQARFVNKKEREVLHVLHFMRDLQNLSLFPGKGIGNVSFELSFL